MLWILTRALNPRPERRLPRGAAPRRAEADAPRTADHRLRRRQRQRKQLQLAQEALHGATEQLGRGVLQLGVVEAGGEGRQVGPCISFAFVCKLWFLICRPLRLLIGAD